MSWWAIHSVSPWCVHGDHSASSHHRGRSIRGKSEFALTWKRLFLQHKDDLLVSSHKWALASGCRTSVQGRECDSEFRTQCHMRLRLRLHKINFWSQLSIVSGDKSHTPAVDLRVWQLSATYYMKHGSHTFELDPNDEIPPCWDPHFSLTGMVSLHGLVCPPPPLAVFTPAGVCVISCSCLSHLSVLPSWALDGGGMNQKTSKARCLARRLQRDMLKRRHVEIKIVYVYIFKGTLDLFHL